MPAMGLGTCSNTLNLAVLNVVGVLQILRVLDRVREEAGEAICRDYGQYSLHSFIDPIKPTKGRGDSIEL